MKNYLLMIFLSFAMFFCFTVLAQDNAPAPASSASGSVVASPEQVQKAVEPPADWIKTAIVFVYQIPYVGPVVLLIFKWITALLTIVTGLCGFLLISFKALSGVLSTVKLVEWAQAVTDFKDNSKVMYWLKYISAFNAPAPKDQKPNGQA